MVYGWTVEYCLNMPAKQFFTMKKVGKKIERRRTASLLAELTMIARVPEMTFKGFEELRSFYAAQVDDSLLRRSKGGMDPTDPVVQRILASQFSSAMNLMEQGYGR